MSVCPRAARSTFALAAALALLLAGCASHEGIAPAVAERSPQQYGAVQTPIDWPREDWWTRFGDPQLDALVAQALAGNPQLDAAGARLARAQAAVAGARAALAPRAQLQLESTWQRFSEHSLYPPPLGGSSEFTNTLQVAGSWELDFFGRNRAVLRAALSADRAAAAEAQAARVLVASAVVRSYMQLAHLLEQHQLLETAKAQREQVLELVGARVRQGLDSSVELHQAEGAVLDLRRQLEASSEQAELLRHALAALLGSGPEATRTLAPRAAGFDAPALPQAIPAELIGRRADLSAARWRVQAASAGVDAARAQFYPNVNLLAFAGLQSLGFGHWLDLGSRNLGIGPALSLPLFDAGALRANLRGRSAELDAAVADYNATLGNAVREVADQIATLRSLQRQAHEQQAVQASAEAAFELASQRYRAGLVNYLSVLAAQTEVLAQQRAAADLRARRTDATVLLMRALGGGFEDSTGTDRNMASQ